MNVEWVRDLCLSFPYATEKISWGHDLTFRVNDKIFAVTVLEPAPVWLSFKCTPETFAELTERDRKSTRLNSSHDQISYAVFCLKKKKTINSSGYRARRPNTVAGTNPDTKR